MSASTQDITAPFDPTAYVNITGAQLLQLVSGASPFNDKGIVVVTTDVAGVPVTPNGNTVTKFQRYIWMRLTANSVGVYVWNPYQANIDPALLNWQSIVVSGIAPGSITGAMIADNTITDIKIAALDWSKILNKPDFIADSDAALGDLTGSTWGNPVVAPGAIGTSKLADGAVTAAKLGADSVVTAKILDVNVTTAKIADDAVTTAKILDANVTAPKLEAAILANAAIPVTAPASGDYLFLGDASAGTTYANIKATLLTCLTTGLAAIRYTQDNIAIPAAGAAIASIAHGLGSTPTFVRWTIKCISAEGGYSVDDEIDASDCNYFTGNVESSLTSWKNATDIAVIRRSAATGLEVAKKSATVGSVFAIDTAKWVLKVYAQL